MSTDGPLAEAKPCWQGEGSRIQQAKKTGSQPQLLQIVAKQGRAVRKVEAKPEPKLTRVAFAVSRLMEFCSKRELQNQTGHSVDDWPLVVAKELFDNALDACEEAEVAPDITVIVDQDRIIVRDNANGIDAKTIEAILDYTIRVSSREAYVSPTRGAQGNALKTILAMAYVLEGTVGVTVIETRGVAHRIEFHVDHIDNQPKIIHTTAPSPIATGTRFTIHWPDPSLLALSEARVKQLVRAYVWFNPHLTVRGVWFGHEFIDVTATKPHWEKWRPRNPTSAHWYDEQRLQRYLAAHVARDRDIGQSRTVREFISEFRGLTGTARQRRILDEVGCSHQSLASFFGTDQVNRDGIARLLDAMKRHSKPVAPQYLGIVGAAHFKARFAAAGGALETFEYQIRKNINDANIPYIIEFAFGLHQAGLDGSAPVPREFVTGTNWSAAISNPFRRFGNTGEGLESLLHKVRITAKQPVICAAHLASAYIQFADRGKSSIILDDAAEQPDD
jgi:hypothetical protein